MTSSALQHLVRNTENTQHIIHELTTHRGWKKTQLAELCHVSPGQVTFWSKGENTPSPEAFGILLSLLNRKLPSEKVCLLEVCDSKILHFPKNWYSSFLFGEIKQEINKFNQSHKGIHENISEPTTLAELKDLLQERHNKYIENKINDEIKDFNYKAQFTDKENPKRFVSQNPPQVIFNKNRLSSAEDLLGSFEEKVQTAKSERLENDKYSERRIDTLKQHLTDAVKQAVPYNIEANQSLNEQFLSHLEMWYRDYMAVNEPQEFAYLNHDYIDLLMMANYVNETIAESRYGGEDDPFDLSQFRRYQWVHDKGKEHELARRLTISHSEIEAFIKKAEEMYERYSQFVDEKRQRYDDIAEKVNSVYPYNPINFNEGYNKKAFERVISEDFLEITDEINMSQIATYLLADKPLSVKLSISDDDMVSLGSTESLASWLEDNLTVDLVTKPTQLCGEIIFELSEVSDDAEQLVIYRTITDSLVYARTVMLRGESKCLLSTPLSASELLEELRSTIGVTSIEEKVKQLLLQQGYMFEDVAFIC